MSLSSPALDVDGGGGSAFAAVFAGLVAAGGRCGAGLDVVLDVDGGSAFAAVFAGLVAADGRCGAGLDVVLDVDGGAASALFGSAFAAGFGGGAGGLDGRGGGGGSAFAAGSDPATLLAFFCSALISFIDTSKSLSVCKSFSKSSFL